MLCKHSLCNKELLKQEPASDLQTQSKKLIWFAIFPNLVIFFLCRFKEDTNMLRCTVEMRILQQFLPR